MRNKRPNRYYLQLVALCFMLATLPVLLLGVLSYFRSSEVVLQRVAEEKRLGLRQTQLAVEQNLKVVDQAVTHFLDTRLVLSALREPLSPEQFQLYNQIKTELTNLQRLDTGIREIRIWSTASNWYIDNEGLFRLDAWAKEHSRGLPQERAPSSLWTVQNSEAEDSTVEKAASAGGSAAEVNFCSTSIVLLKKLPLTSYENTGRAAIEIPACRLGGLFSPESQLEPVFLFNEDMEPILALGKPEAELGQLLRHSLAARSADSADSFRLEANGAPYAIHYRVSEYNGWIYVSAVPLNDLYRQSREIGWFTFYICLGLLALFAFLALYGSKRLYRPIGRMVEEVISAGAQEAGVRTRDELALIGGHVERLFLDKKELESTVTGQNRLLRTYFMVRLFTGGLKQEELERQLGSYGMNRDFSWLAVLAVQIRDLEKTRFGEEDRDLLLFAVNNVIGELLKPPATLEPILLGRTQLTVLLGKGPVREEFIQETYITAKRIAATLEEFLQLSVIIGISGVHALVGEIPQAREEAEEALRRQPAFGGQTIVGFAELGESHDLHYAYPHDLQADLFQAVKLLERERVPELLRELLAHIQEVHSAPYDRQFHMVRLLMNLLGLANSIARQAIPMQRQHSLFDELFQLDIPAQAEEWFYSRLLEPVMEAMEEQTEARHLAIAKDMVRMVHEEFDTDLTLEACAERLHYNADYAGAIFRKAMNMPFSAYLAQHRHQTAIRWLKETTMPIKDIAEKLCYNNSQNFIRSFRKLEGVSPGKYRESFLKAISGNQPPEGEEEQ